MRSNNQPSLRLLIEQLSKSTDPKLTFAEPGIEASHGIVANAEISAPEHTLSPRYSLTHSNDDCKSGSPPRYF